MDRLMPKGKNEKVIELMKDELGKKKYEKLCWTKKKTYSYLTYDSNEDKKARGAKEYRRFENNRNCLEATQLENEIN